jgi:ABC-2 type transport system ATP-binding protein
MASAAIRLIRLSKVYANGKGIFDLELEVERGEIFGFLGPNGAGKTTTIRTLLGLLHPTGGRAEILSRDIVADPLVVRALTGYLPAEPALYGYLTGEENIRLALRVRRVDGWRRAEELARRFDAPLRQKVRHLSHGQRQKVAIIQALAHRPQLLLLDEPTIGLDPLMQETFYDLLRGEQAGGTTVFMSSHNLKEVEITCGRVGIVRDGRLAAVDSIEGLRKSRLKHVAVEFGSPAPTADEVARLTGVSSPRVDRGRLRFAYQGDLDGLTRLLAAYRVLDLNVEDPGLEEVFRAFYDGSAARSGDGGGGEGRP